MPERLRPNDRIAHREVEMLIEVIQWTGSRQGNGSLFFNGRKVLRAWKSFSGWYWFATEKILNRKAA
jgi:hypothetical protein